MKLLVLLVAAFVVLASAKTSTLYARVSIQGRTSSSDHIVALDPKTGATKDIMQTFAFTVENSAVHGLSAMDENGVYYYASGANPFPNFVCRANVNSQTMMSHGAYPITQLISFAYDTNQERLFVAGAQDSSLDIPLPFGTQLVSWPTAAGSYPKVYAQLDTDGSFIATTGAIDSANQIYYWIAMPKPNTILLKSLSVATAFGQVNSVQLQCNNQLDPLSMTFDSVRQKLMLYGGLYNKNEGMYTLYINTVDSTGKCNAVMTTLTYTQYVSTFGYDEVNQVLYVSVDSTLYTLNARTGAIINTVTIANGLVPYTLNVMYN